MPSLGIDIGGTKIASGLVHSDGTVHEVRSRPVTGMGETALQQVLDVARSYLAVHPVAHVGVALPGGVDPKTRVVTTAPNLGWTDMSLAQRLSAALDRQVHVENDANCAAWAEHRFGAGRGRTNTVLITIGTGIGGGLVVSNRLLVGHHGLGAELGHIPLVIGGHPCKCGASGCWEQYASGSALRAEARRRNWRPGPVTGEEVLRAAADGDPAAVHIVEWVSGHLAHGLTTMAAFLDPGEVVLGGGLGSDKRFVEYVDTALAAFHPSSSRGHVTVRPAELGIHSGVIGAADLAATIHGSAHC
ncbi:ROK family protein [Streptomyces sp. NPDC050625]|uniref:ROK family protein n=1 Tax=Streptomyces sp. NPDC050625 TaxID=3154629 RepID=UPI00342A9944